MSTPEPEPDAYEPRLRRNKMRNFSGKTDKRRDQSVPLRGRGLLIGIRGYVREPLKNTVHDATDIADTLDHIGFDEVKLLTDDNGADLSFLGIQDAIWDFVDSVDENTVAVFGFFGAHSALAAHPPRSRLMLGQATAPSSTASTTCSRRRWCRSTSRSGSSPGRCTSRTSSRSWRPRTRS